MPGVCGINLKLKCFYRRKKIEKQYGDYPACLKTQSYGSDWPVSSKVWTAIHTVEYRSFKMTH